MSLLSLAVACTLGPLAHAPPVAARLPAPRVDVGDFQHPQRVTAATVSVVAWTTEGSGDTASAPLLTTTRSEQNAAVRMRYPSLMRDAGIEGNAWVEVWVDPEGRVIAGCTEVREATHDLFRDGAERVANRLRFTPAQVGETPVPTHLMLLIRFTLPS
jgi:TonB family protein